MTLHDHSARASRSAAAPPAPTSMPVPPTSVSVPATMRAVVQDSYGSVDVLRSAQVPVPEIGGADVLVRVAAAGLDRGTWHLMTGRPYLMRVIGFGVRRPRNRVAGLAFAGTVVAVGSEVNRFAPGDAVFGIGRGTFGEFTAAPASKIAHIPAGLSLIEAAAVPISAPTALQALCDVGRVEAGQRVLVLGASGGVGSYAVQLAKALGAEVTGVAGAAKLDLVRALGADRALDYASDDFADGTTRYDLILDAGGNSPLSRLRRALTATGTLVLVGGESKGNLTGGFERQLRAAMLSPFVGQRLTMCAAKERGSDLERLSPFLKAGTVVPSIDRSYPLDRVRAAMQRLDAGQVRGKVVLTVRTS